MKTASGKEQDTRPQIREPRQKRAIEKKAKIVQACMELVSEKGYRSTTTVDIAKRAGVSTGIVYSYFKDKKDILLSALYQLFDQMCDPLFELLSSYSDNDDLLANLDRLMDLFEESHRKYKKPHQELTSLSAIDSDIAALTDAFEKRIVAKCVEALKQHTPSLTNIQEKVHLTYHLVEIYCHESTLYPNPDIDYSAMRSEIMNCIAHLLNQ